MLVFFGLMLVTSLVYGGLTSFGHQAVTTPDIARHHLRMMVGFELMDTVLVGLAFLAIGHPRSWRRVSDVPPAWQWTAAVVGIFLVVAVNRGYHTVLRGYLGLVPMRDAIVASTGVTPLVLVSYCLEPALIEEMFFRYLALDTLRSAMSVHAAVVVSSVMFGLAHIGAPLSIPMLTLVGVALGYARVASGRLALPMLLHFLHNLIIVLVE